MEEKQRVRSPRYPSMSLRDAEILARSIYEKDGKNAVARESAVQHMGYSSLNGASATALASLKQYGLVVDAGKGTLRLTETALDIIEPESEQGRIAAIRTAAFSPEVFASLREKFPNSPPSESNLRAHLVRQDFTSAAVKSVVPAYLDTCRYVEETGGQERSRRPNDEDQVSVSATLPERISVSPSQTASQPDTTHIPVLHGTRRMIFDTEEGEVAFTYPESLTADSVADIEEWFALVVKRLRRSSRQ